MYLSITWNGKQLTFIFGSVIIHLLNAISFFSGELSLLHWMWASMYLSLAAETKG